MAILTEDDLPIYAPSVTLTGDALEGALILAQSLVESPMGADRPLEKTLVTEVLELNEFQTCFLRNFPILEDPPILVDVRSASYRDWIGYRYPPGDWKPVEDFTLDNNELTLVLSEYFFYPWYNENRHEKPPQEARVKYWSGFDFEEDSPDVRYIKSHTGNVLSYLQSPVYQGVRRLDVPFREFSISFSDKGPTSSLVPPELLAPFKKFQPLRYPV